MEEKRICEVGATEVLKPYTVTDLGKMIYKTSFKGIFCRMHNNNRMATA
jgi:hypothetical protein